MSALNYVMIVLAVGSIAGCSSSTISPWEGRDLRFGVEALVPPFESRNAQGELVGLNIELGNALCAELDVKCHWVDQDYATNIDALEAGRFDAIMPMSATPLRRQRIEFTDSLYTLDSRLVTRVNRNLTPDPASLEGKRVGVLAGTSRQAFAKARWETAGVVISTFQFNDELIRSLMAGEIDATLQDTIEISQALLDTPQRDGFGFSGPPVKDELLGSGIAIGVRQSDTTLRIALNSALLTLKESGQYADIVNRYLQAE